MFQYQPNIPIETPYNEWQAEFVKTFYVYNLVKDTPAGAEKEALKFIQEHIEEAYKQGRKSIIDEVNHAQKKLLDGFSHSKDCEMCIDNTNKQ